MLSNLAQTGFNIGNGICLYQTNNTNTGSLLSLPYVFSKPFRLLRVGIGNLNSSGTVTAFTSAVSVEEYKATQFSASGYSNANAYNILQQTPSATPSGQLEFIFGEGYEFPANTIIAAVFTAAATNITYVETVVEYI